VIEVVIGLQLGVLALILFAAGGPLTDRVPRAGDAVAIGRWVALAGCITLVGGGLFGDVTPEHDTPNPIPRTVRSVDAGAALFSANCAACHGADGRGGGPMAPTTRTRPANLRAGHLASHTDGDLYFWIGSGRPGGMPAWASSLSATSRWNLVNYLRALDGMPVVIDPQASGFRTRDAALAAGILPGILGAPVAVVLALAWLAGGLRRSRRR
jgi:mono/diheme cytochrome c family protein